MEQTLLHWQHGKAFRHLIYYDFFYTGAFASGLQLFNHCISTFLGKREVNMKPVTKAEATGWFHTSATNK